MAIFIINDCEGWQIPINLNANLEITCFLTVRKNALQKILRNGATHALKKLQLTVQYGTD